MRSCLWRAGALAVLVLGATDAFAVKHGSWSVGAGSYSTRGDRKVGAGSEGAVANSVSVTPLIFRYEHELSGNLYLAPQLMLTVMPLKSWDESYTTAIHHLNVPVNGPIGEAGGFDCDWGLGLGIMMYEMKGKGGTVTLRNGTGTAEFAVAGGAKSSKMITTNFGLSASSGSHRIGLDLTFESILSNQKRAYSYLVGYTYRFGGSH